MKKALAAGGAAFLILPLLLVGMLLAVIPGATMSTMGGAGAVVNNTANCDNTSSDDTGSAEGGTSAGVPEVAVKLAKAMADAGYSRASTAGVMGNMQGESGFRPTAASPDGGYGIAQWTPRSKIRRWFDGHGLNGVPDSDADGQIKMLIGTVESDFNNYYYAKVTNISKKATLLETWRTAPDAKTAAIAYMAGWERPNWALRHEDVRVSAANGFYNSAELAAISWKTPDGSAPGGDTGGSAGGDTSGSVQQAACGSSDPDLSGVSGKMGKAIAWARATATDESVGYSQARRRLNPDVDCSSFVYYAMVRGGGFTIGDGNSPWNTWGMEKQLPGLNFEKVGGSGMNPKDMKPGDILLNPDKHTEIFTGIQDGTPKSIGAHSDRGHPAGGDQDGTEVNEKGMWKGFTQVWRYKGAD